MLHLRFKNNNYIIFIRAFVRCNFVKERATGSELISLPIPRPHVTFEPEGFNLRLVVRLGLFFNIFFTSYVAFFIHFSKMSDRDVEVWLACVWQRMQRASTLASRIVRCATEWVHFCVVDDCSFISDKFGIGSAGLDG